VRNERQIEAPKTVLFRTLSTVRVPVPCSASNTPDPATSPPLPGQEHSSTALSSSTPSFRSVSVCSVSGLRSVASELRRLASVPRKNVPRTHTPRSTLNTVFQQMRRAAAALKSKRMQARLASLNPKRSVASVVVSRLRPRQQSVPCVSYEQASRPSQRSFCVPDVSVERSEVVSRHALH
jgi:hypothetical protein